MCMSTPKAPTPPPPPPPPPAAPTVDEVQVTEARDRERRRIRSAEGQKSTMLTSALGDTSQAPTVQKVLLGA